MKIITAFLLSILVFATPVFAGGPLLSGTLVDQPYQCPKAPATWGVDGIRDAEWVNPHRQNIYITGVIVATEFGPTFTSYVNVFFNEAGGLVWLGFQGGVRGQDINFAPNYFVLKPGISIGAQVWCNGNSSPGQGYAFVAVRYSLTPP